MMLSSIKAVAFDAFGTLVDIHDKRRPYAKLAAKAVKQVQSPMTRRISLESYADDCSAVISSEDLSDLSSDLEAEITSTRPFIETVHVLKTLRDRGIRTAVASNLAFPYAQLIQAKLGHLLDAECWSFDVGSTKPDFKFYAALSALLQLSGPEILMVGDSWRGDFLGAKEAGFQALFLDRSGIFTEDRRSVSIASLSGLLDHFGSSFARTM